VHAYLGYPAPWTWYQIQADSFASGAFATGTGEMFSQTINREDGRRAEARRNIAGSIIGFTCA
jgi:hypothetical protein